MNVQPLDGRTAALKQECLNQFQNCGYTALTFTIWLRFLRWIKLFSLFAPVVLGALATWNIVGDSMPAAAAVTTARLPLSSIMVSVREEW